jgi:hypothetical protein
MSEVEFKKIQKSRKEWKCKKCNEVIPIGSTYWKELHITTSFYGGKWIEHDKLCRDCTPREVKNKIEIQRGEKTWFKDYLSERDVLLGESYLNAMRENIEAYKTEIKDNKKILASLQDKELSPPRYMKICRKAWTCSECGKEIPSGSSLYVDTAYHLFEYLHKIVNPDTYMHRERGEVRFCSECGVPEAWKEVKQKCFFKRKRECEEKIEDYIANMKSLEDEYEEAKKLLEEAKYKKKAN